jgi:molybdopterin-biosynthesis enzyme MoeA-like protein
MEIDRKGQKTSPSAQHSRVVYPAVVTVGDELILGERSNDNQVWLLRTLQESGYPAQVAVCLPDSIEVIARWLRQLVQQRCYPILVSGGIGGTHDDCTREAVAVALDVPLKRHPLCHRILAKKYGKQYTAGRQRMAMLPQGCDLIANPSGAPGFSMGGIYAFPGFPNMLEPMAQGVLATLLPATSGGRWVVREYTLPLHEGQIASDIENFVKHHESLRVGIYPSAVRYRQELTIRLRCPPDRQEALRAFAELIASISEKYAVEM